MKNLLTNPRWCVYKHHYVASRWQYIKIELRYVFGKALTNVSRIQGKVTENILTLMKVFLK